MQQMVDWFRSFLAADWDAFVAYYLEPDYEAFKVKADAYLTYCDVPSVAGVAGLTARGPGFERDWTKFAKKVNKKSAPRLLMAVQRFETSSGSRWGFITSSIRNAKSGRAISVRWLVGEVDGVLKVTARENFSQESGWELEQGERVELGEPVETLKITPPTNAMSLAAYEAL